MLVFIALIYCVLAVLFYYKYGSEWHLAFAVVFLTSGFVYLSAVVALTSIFYKTITTNSVSYLGVFKTGIFGFCISFLHFVASSHEVNVLAIIQIIALFFIIANSKRVINSESIRVIAMGAIIGFLLVVANLLYTLGMFGIVLQEKFSYFSISGTFNYTGYYIIFGGILSPYLLRNAVRVRWIFFILSLFACFLLQNRAGFILGIFLFYSINFNLHQFRIQSFVVASITSITGIYFLLHMGLINSNNPNDIVYSVFNFEVNTSNMERLDMISTVFEQLEKHPFGWGADQSNHALKSYGFSHPHTHNTLTQWAVEYGYLGLFLFLTLVLNIFRPVLKGELATKRLPISLFIFMIFWINLEAVQYNILVSLITVYFILIINYIPRALPKYV